MNIMLITKITPNINSQSKPAFKTSRVGSPTHRQGVASALVTMPYYQTSFGSVKISPVVEAVERKGVKLVKKYQVTPNGAINVVIDKLHTLGEQPVICYSHIDEMKTIQPLHVERHGVESTYQAKWVGSMFPMAKVGDEYKFCPDVLEPDRFKYAVYYQDTKKWDDNGGEGYLVERSKIVGRAFSWDKKEHGQPLLRIIRRGTAKGKVVLANSLFELLEGVQKTKEPIIAVVKDFVAHGKDDVIGYIPSNVKGVIFTASARSTLCHAATDVRSLVDASAMFYDEKQIEELQKMAGKFISLDVSPCGVKWQSIMESEVGSVNSIRPQIQIPEIKTTDKLLTSAEYESDIVGPKAYNLRRLEEMKQRGQLQEVKIPSSFAIPTGIFDKILDVNPDVAVEIQKRISEIDSNSTLTGKYGLLQELRDKICNELTISESIRKEIGSMTKAKLGKSFIIRSAFNGEDVKGYSAAGLYDSTTGYSDVDPSHGILFVYASKWNYQAYMSRMGYNIDHGLIKPTVILQENIPADYRFTLYTKSPEDVNGNKVLVQMMPPRGFRSFQDPYFIKYDRDTHEVEVESIARRGRKITLDEDMNVVDAEPINDPILKDLDKWEAKLKKVCEAALEVEKEFGAPQDIEGGIKFTKDGDVDTSQIYFWQAREQVQ